MQPKTYTIEEARDYLHQKINRGVRNGSYYVRDPELETDVQPTKPVWFLNGMTSQSAAVTVKFTETTSMTKYVDLQDGKINGLGFRVLVEHLCDIIP